MSEQEKHLRQGTKGLAGRVLDQPPIGRATSRSALQRVARRAASRDSSPPGAAPAQKPPSAAPAQKHPGAAPAQTLDDTSTDKSTRAASPGKSPNRAAQAALGMMGRKPADFDVAALRSWLAGLSEEDIKKLSGLISAARQSDPTQPSAPGKRPFDQVASQLEQRGIQFSVSANTVIVNIGDGAAPRAPSRGQPRDREYRADWGRSWGRVKEFINGH